MAEQYDQEGDDILYFDRADDLWVVAKNAYAAGKILKRIWKQIEQKYLFYAWSVSEKESGAINDKKSS